VTPARLAECLMTIRWSPTILSRYFGCDVSLVEAWLVGEVEIPAEAGAWKSWRRPMKQPRTSDFGTQSGFRFRAPHDYPQSYPAGDFGSPVRLLLSFC
jgi:hypothetical protein